MDDNFIPLTTRIGGAYMSFLVLYVSLFEFFSPYIIFLLLPYSLSLYWLPPCPFPTPLPRPRHARRCWPFPATASSAVAPLPGLLGPRAAGCAHIVPIPSPSLLARRHYPCPNRCLLMPGSTLSLLPRPRTTAWRQSLATARSPARCSPVPRDGVRQVEVSRPIRSSG
jgi:hypothetical protein